MPVKVAELVTLLESFAPPALAEEWDNVGLLTGRSDRAVTKVLLALDVTPEVVGQAVSVGAEMIISHHPLIFSPLKSLAETNWHTRMLAMIIKNELAVYSAHTNLDMATDGVNDVLAKKLSLLNVEKLHTGKYEELHKIAVFVPLSHAEVVATAMTQKGAGHIGNYSDCTFQMQGTGTFRPLEGSSPFIGQNGQLEKVKEIKIETIVNANRQQEVIAAMLAAHPYEEVAYDIYTLLNKNHSEGLGRIGELPDELDTREFAKFVKVALDIEHILYVDAGKPVKKVAVCGGAGGDFLKYAIQAGVDLFLTGDVKYHTAQEALLSDISIVDAGHQGTEKHIMPVLAEKIKIWDNTLEVILAKEKSIFQQL